MGGHLLMSRKELQRKSVLELVATKHITLQEASQRMMLSYRQTLRVYSRFCAEAIQALYMATAASLQTGHTQQAFEKK